MRGALLGLLLMLAPLAARSEAVLADLSQRNVALTATFEGSEILIFGAVFREEPVPAEAGRLAVIVTVQGPSRPLSVWRRARRAGVWMNVEEVRVSRAPTFYSVATSAPLAEALSFTEDLRYRISIPLAIRAIGALATVADAPAFTEALIRLRSDAGFYQLNEGTVTITRDTLFRTTVALPASLTEGVYGVRVFLTRDGQVIDTFETGIDVRKAGIERWLYNLAQEQPLAYGLLAVALAVAAGWAASTAFRLLRA
jgi:uncharacterized protein (TIGR02186 family)